MSTLRKHLWVTAVSVGISAAIPLSANAAPLPFKIDTNSLGLTGTPFAGQPFTATDIFGPSNALIRQTGLSQQTETGWIQFTGYSNNSTNVGNGISRITSPNDVNAGNPAFYFLYATFTAVVNGISGFGPNQIGTIAPGDFNFTVFADKGANNSFNVGSTSNTGGTAPSVTDPGTNDIVLAQGSSLFGSAGFQPGTGAPIFATTSEFAICNGIPNQGLVGSKAVVATNCGTFDATKYFVDPVPFYQFNFTSTTAGSANNLTVNPGVPGPPNATLNGIVADVNFTIPEPGTVALLGATLLVAGLGSRSRRM